MVVHRRYDQLSLPGLEQVLMPIKQAVVSLARQPWISWGWDIDWSLLETLDPDHPPVILSYGMGVDSTAMLLRFLFDPVCRDFPLSNLVLVIAMTGDEWARTRWLVERFVLPLCCHFGIWVVQVSRHGERESDGIMIHSSSRCPQQLYIKGDYRLSQHLLVNGVVPQKAKGKRFCTMKFKAFPIDQVVKLFFGDSPQSRYRRMIGYNADETARAEGDNSYSTDSSRPRYLVGYNSDEVERSQRDSSYALVSQSQHYRYLLGFNANEVNRQKQEAATWRNQLFEFPLIKWGWDRQQCERYIAETTYLLELTQQLWEESSRPLERPLVIRPAGEAVIGAELAQATWWSKSFCQYCPFSCSNGADDLKRRHRLRRSSRGSRSQGGSSKTQAMIRRWAEQPEGGGLAAYIEHSALAFSHYSGALYDSGAKKARRPVNTVLQTLQEAGIEAAIADYHQRVEANPYWAVYVVRRVFKKAIPPGEAAQARARTRGRVAKPIYPTPPRYVQKLFVGSRAEAHAYLNRLAQAYGQEVKEIALCQRFWSIPRPRDERRRPFVEEMFVCVFVEAKDKSDQRIDFATLWQSVTGSLPSIREPAGEEP